MKGKRKPVAQQERLKWFERARFGMFIHWGISSVLGRGEWAMYWERIPREEYAELAKRWNPKPNAPEEWVALAKSAGMRYIVLTTRHHDGYSLFDSKVSDFTSAKTRPGRDLVGEFVRACRRGGIKIGFYYSLLDWRFPAYFAGPEEDPCGWAELVKYVHSQVRELMTQYGKIDILWYDGAWPYTADAWRSRQLNRMVRKLQPGILINNRSKLPEDFDTPEQHIARSPSGRAWETCMTMNDHWAYYQRDYNWKSTRRLIMNLVRTTSGSGNYLLNVGPRPDGTIPGASVIRLKEMGKWLEVNGKSIYGCGASPFGGGTVGATTAKGSTVYLHAFYWPGEEICIPGIKNKVKSARLLTTGKKLTVWQKPGASPPASLAGRQASQAGRLFIGGLPKKAPDPYVSVIVLKLEGKPEREAGFPQAW